jgi:hypothetical protein
MNFTRAQENVNTTFFSSGLDGGTRSVDVCTNAAGETADDRAANGLGDFSNRFEVTPTGDGKAGLDDIDP